LTIAGRLCAITLIVFGSAIAFGSILTALHTLSAILPVAHR
jgi:hypothetical protein